MFILGSAGNYSPSLSIRAIEVSASNHILELTDIVYSNVRLCLQLE